MHTLAGLVRAVDVASNNVYLMPSVATAELEKVNTLAVCGVPLPMCMLLEQHSRTKLSVPVPYLYRVADTFSLESKGQVV